jgi:hypothetical protein
MTTLLDEAYAKAAKLPPKEQDALGAMLLEEMACESRWQELLAGSQDQLSRLVDEALAEFQAGKTLPLLYGLIYYRPM